MGDCRSLLAATNSGYRPEELEVHRESRHVSAQCDSADRRLLAPSRQLANHRSRLTRAPSSFAVSLHGVGVGVAREAAETRMNDIGTDNCRNIGSFFRKRRHRGTNAEHHRTSADQRFPINVEFHQTVQLHGRLTLSVRPHAILTAFRCNGPHHLRRSASLYEALPYFPVNPARSAGILPFAPNCWPAALRFPEAAAFRARILTTQFDAHG